MERGKVWLVGAGPGDIGLLTLKAKQVIEEADLIAYDALVGDEILCSLPEGTEKISVGKRSGRHSVPQEETNSLLLEQALSGKKVVRLKGGDPFVFGRGGEELELLAEHGIPFEVVPGITSAAAVPAYAGIPLTHRELTSSFHVITAHPRADGEDRTNYEALVKMDATLVFLMGVRRMETVLGSLLDAGMDPDMPAAVVSEGTRHGQRKIVSTVSALAQEAKAAGIGTPAVIIVGRVCSLAEQFSWFEKRPLSGREILVTRPAEKESRLAAMLREEGAEVLEIPMIKTQLLPTAEIRLERLFGEEKRDVWLTFTSPSGVEHFFEAMDHCGYDIRTLFCAGRKVHTAAVGKGTEAKMRRHGLKADIIPERYSGADLGQMLTETAAKGAKVFILSAKETGNDLTDALEKSGLDWEKIPLYETKQRERYEFLNVLKDKLEQKDLLAAAFASASAVRGFADTVGIELLTGFTAVCIGEKTAEEAKRYGMDTVISDQATVTGLVRKIKELAL